MYDPDCGNCEHFNDCVMRKALKSARETIFNMNREMPGRKDFILDGKLIPAEPSEARREYEAAVEQAQYCELYEPTYDPDTGAL